LKNVIIRTTTDNNNTNNIIKKGIIIDNNDIVMTSNIKSPENIYQDDQNLKNTIRKENTLPFYWKTVITSPPIIQQKVMNCLPVHPPAPPSVKKRTMKYFQINKQTNKQTNSLLLTYIVFLQTIYYFIFALFFSLSSSGNSWNRKLH